MPDDAVPHDAVPHDNSAGGAWHGDPLFLALTAAAAAADVVSYLGLGQVFPANMTGNTVLLGIGLSTGDLAGAARSGTALGGFLLAVVLVSLAVPGRGWSRAVPVTLGVECVVLAGLAAWWLAVLSSHPSGVRRYGLIALAGSAMGAQSATVRRLRGAGVATTYITGTWTAVAVGVTARLRDRVHRRSADGSPGHSAADSTEDSGLADGALRRQITVVLAYAVTALVVGVAFAHWAAYAALIPAALLALAVSIAHRAGPALSQLRAPVPR